MCKDLKCHFSSVGATKTWNLLFIYNCSPAELLSLWAPSSGRYRFRYSMTAVVYIYPIYVLGDSCFVPLFRRYFVVVNIGITVFVGVQRHPPCPPRAQKVAKERRILALRVYCCRRFVVWWYRPLSGIDYLSCCW